MACYDEDLVLDPEIIGLPKGDDDAKAPGAGAFSPQARGEDRQAPMQQDDPAEQALGTTRLGKIQGLVYPSPSYMEVYHPAVLAFMIFFLLSDSMSAWLPSTTWDNVDPPPVPVGPTANAESRFKIPFALAHLPYFVFGPRAARPPLWVYIVNPTISVIASSLGLYFFGVTNFCAMGAVLLYPLWTCKVNRFPLFIFVLTLGLLSVFYAYFQILFNLPKLLAMVPNSFIAASIVPVGASIVTGILVPFSPWVAARFARPGSSPYIVFETMMPVLLISDIFRLYSMVNSITWSHLITTACFSIAGDLASRTLAPAFLRARFASKLGSRCPALASCLGKAVEIDPGTDLFLRSRFVVNYWPVLFYITLSLVAMALGAAWARKAFFWLALWMYLGSTALCDFAITLLHFKMYPREGESFRSLAFRLSTDPRAHWPKYQPSGPVAKDLWVPSSLAVRMRFLTDAHLSTMMGVCVACSFAMVSLRISFGDCYLYINPHRC